jgi:hypothetical protein
MIRSSWVRLYALLLVTILSTGCDLAQGIFKAGFAVGLIVIVIVVGLVLFLVAKMRR